MCNNKLTDVGIFIINYTFHYHLIIVKHRLTGKNCINDSYTFVVMLKGSVLLMEWLRVFWYPSKNLRINQCTKRGTRFRVVTCLTHLVPSPQRLQRGHSCTNQRTSRHYEDISQKNLREILGWMCYFWVWEMEFVFLSYSSKKKLRNGQCGWP